MIIEVKKGKPQNLSQALSQMKRPKKKTLADVFGKLKRGIDGMEYQKIMRNEWN